MKFSNFKTKTKVLIGVCSPLLLLLVLGAVSVFNINTIVKTNGWVEHTYDVLAEAAAVVGSAVDMETGMRGYLLAGEEGFLDPYKGGEKAAYAQIKKLKETVSDNPGQVKRLTDVENTLKEWQSKIVNPTIELRRTIGDAKTMNDMAKVVGEARGKAYFDKFRGQIATFIEREASLLDTRREDFGKAFTILQRIANSGLLDAGATKENLKILKDNEGWVAHTYKVIARANSILSAGVDMETGMRGYLLAGKEEFLAPYNGGKAMFYELSANLKETVSDNAAQVKLLTEIEENISAWQKDVTEPTIALRRAIGTAKTMDDMADLIAEARGKVYFDKFRGLMAAFSKEETGLMNQRQESNKSTVSSTYTIIATCIVVALVIGLFLAILIGNGVANPINRMTDAMKNLADGDKTVEIPGLTRKDEIGDMSGAVQIFKDNMIKAEELQKAQDAEQKMKMKRAESVDKMIDLFRDEATDALDGMKASSVQMEENSQNLAANAEQTAQQAAAVATASDQAAANVETVAGAAEELSSSVNEINVQIDESSRITEEARQKAESTNELVNSLDVSVQRIGEVVDLINNIADQTNLLALNATIEAARAGDAGKGFAVVASEVKNLANQTGHATEEIGSQIQAVQNSTRDAVGAIRDISEVINRVSSISGSIVAALEEQSAATGEIARNVQEASSGTSEVSANISGVNTAATDAGKAAGDVLSAAQSVNQQTATLREKVEVFLTNVQAA